MTFAIYQVRTDPESPIFYDVEFNNLIGSLELTDSVTDLIEQIEDKTLEEFHSFIFYRFVSIYDYYYSASSCIKIYEHEFIDTEDLQTNLRNLIQEHRPELLI